MPALRALKTPPRRALTRKAGSWAPTAPETVTCAAAGSSARPARAATELARAGACDGAGWPRIAPQIPASAAARSSVAQRSRRADTPAPRVSAGHDAVLAAPASIGLPGPDIHSSTSLLLVPRSGQRHGASSAVRSHRCLLRLTVVMGFP